MNAKDRLQYWKMLWKINNSIIKELPEAWKHRDNK